MAIRPTAYFERYSDLALAESFIECSQYSELGELLEFLVESEAAWLFYKILTRYPNDPVLLAWKSQYCDDF